MGSVTSPLHACLPRGHGGVWHKASVLACVPLAAPIGLSQLLIRTLCGPERVLVVSTEPPDDLSCLTTPGVGCPGDGLLPVPLTRCIQMYTASPCGGLPTPALTCARWGVHLQDNFFGGVVEGGGGLLIPRKATGAGPAAHHPFPEAVMGRDAPQLSIRVCPTSSLSVSGHSPGQPQRHSQPTVLAPNRFGNRLQPPADPRLGPPLAPLPFQYIPGPPHLRTPIPVGPRETGCGPARHTAGTTIFQTPGGGGWGLRGFLYEDRARLGWGLRSRPAQPEGQRAVPEP